MAQRGVNPGPFGCEAEAIITERLMTSLLKLLKVLLLSVSQVKLCLNGDKLMLFSEVHSDRSLLNI